MGNESLGVWGDIVWGRWVRCTVVGSGVLVQGEEAFVGFPTMFGFFSRCDRGVEINIVKR